MMKPIASLLARTQPSSSHFVLPPSSFYFASFIRGFATQSSNASAGASSAKRRAVTPFNDDGFVPWRELSAGEKASRASQQSFNFGIIIVGILMTGGVGYFLWHDIFSPDSKISYFNRAVDKVKADPRCLELLTGGTSSQNARKITAHGDETFNRWRRARPVSSTERTDKDGTRHLQMHFYVEGPANRGVVQLHLVKTPRMSDFEYKYLTLKVHGQDSIYLEKADASATDTGKKQLSMFGVKWN